MAYHPVDKERYDVAAFDRGESYIGTEWADKVEDFGRKTLQTVVGGIHAASQDQEGWHDDVLRGIGTGAKWVGQKWQEGTADQEGIHDDILRGVGFVGQQGLRLADAASYYGGKAGGAVAKSVGVDPRIGGVIGNVFGEAVTGFGAKKALQIGKYVKRGDYFDDLVRAAAPEGSTYRMMLDTGGGVVSPKRARGGGVKTTERLFTPEELVGNRNLKADLARMAETGITDPVELRKLRLADEGSFTNVKGIPEVLQRKRLGASPHHFGVDLDLAGHVLNRTDNVEISRILREELDVFPGDHINNFIASFHDNTAKIVHAQKKQLTDLSKGKLTYREAAEIVKKNNKNVPPDLGIMDLINKGIDPDDTAAVKKALKELPDKTTDTTRYSRHGVDIHDFELPTNTLAIDHQELIHGLADKLPLRKKLIELTKTDEWLKLTPREAAIKIAEVSLQQQNIALNVSKWRLQKIIKRMKADGVPHKHWTDIMTWIVQDPTRAAHLDWHKTAQFGTGLTEKQLLRTPSRKNIQQTADVFGLMKVPDTANKLRRMKAVQEGFGRVTNDLVDVSSNGFK